MKLFVPLCASVPLFLVGCGSKTPGDLPKSPGAQQITIDAAGGKKVFADLYTSQSGKAKAVVLMFHQAHSSAGEYDIIAPKVKGPGFDCLAVDQRSGGDMYGANRTANQYSGDPGYMAAYADIERALGWAEKQGYKTIVVWGSSYSASFAFRLASEHKDVSAVIAFSPGEYFDDKTIVAKWAGGVRVPVLAVCTDKEEPDVSEILKSSPPGAAARLLRSGPDAIHGSSTLLPDKNPTGSQKYWNEVSKFLSAFGTVRHPKPGRPTAGGLQRKP